MLRKLIALHIFLLIVSHQLSSQELPIAHDILDDGVERWYRIKKDHLKPAFFEQTERAFNVKIVAEDYSRLPFEKSIAFLIGVSKYENINPLPFVENDIIDLRNFLLSQGGFDTVFVATNKIVTKDLIEDYMANKFRKSLKKKDRLLFYYSGHGADFGGITGYILLSRANPRIDFVSHVLPIKRCREWSKLLKLEHILFLYDCCASGFGFTERAVDTEDFEKIISTFSGTGSRTVITAGTADESTYEVRDESGKGNGVFTRALLDAVEYGLKNNENGFVTISEIFAKTEIGVKNFAAEYEKTITPRLWSFDERKYRGSFLFINPYAKRLADQFSELLNVQIKPQFRSAASSNLTKEKVKKMIKEKGFFDNQQNKDGKFLTHDFLIQEIAGDSVVLSDYTGLMWQLGRASGEMNLVEAREYIKTLNRELYAGFGGWRLPTLEEAMSTISPLATDLDYINPAFDRNRKTIWTADRLDRSHGWLVFTLNGYCDIRNIQSRRGKYVRAVRTITAQPVVDK